MKSILRMAIVFLTALGLGKISSAQNVQENPVWATQPVKVDGKTNTTDFGAFNKSTKLFYTMSNDDKNLYMVIKSSDNSNNNKIMMGGITLTINTDGKRKEKDGFLITYPLIVRQQASRGQSSGGQRQVYGGGREGGQRSSGGSFGQRTQSTSNAADSTTIARRKQQLASVKEIKVFGFNTITDSLISIYNEHNILVAANFDEKGAFVYELSIPLNLLGLTEVNNEFAYNVKINGFQFSSRFSGGERTMSAESNEQRGGGSRSNFDPAAFLPTDFWGKYSLAKK
ncbi:MAG: hypothetical protein ACO1N7_10380 [Sphingobacteriaceae bacterium]